MSRRRTPRTWSWAALGVQFAGLVCADVWHGLLHPTGFQRSYKNDMITHQCMFFVAALPLLLASLWAKGQTNARFVAVRAIVGARRSIPA
jgi:hypothetical protein